MAFNWKQGVQKTGQQIGSGLSKAGASIQQRMREANERARAEAIERAKYERELAIKMREARQKAHMEESVKQARIQGVLNAKKKFGQHKQSNNLFGGSPTFDSLIFGIKPKKAHLKSSIKSALGTSGGGTKIQVGNQVITISPLKENIAKSLKPAVKKKSAIDDMIWRL